MNTAAWAEKVALQKEIADVEAKLEHALTQGGGAHRSVFERRLKILRGQLAQATPRAAREFYALPRDPARV